MGWQQRSPSEREIAAMQALIEQGMEDGAVGFSTGLSYPPNSYAGTDELIQLCRTVARHNGFYVTHMRNYFDQIFEALTEAIRIGQEAQVPRDDLAPEDWFGAASGQGGGDPGAHRAGAARGR